LRGLIFDVSRLEAFAAENDLSIIEDAVAGRKA
jgi:hypothetical protein